MNPKVEQALEALDQGIAGLATEERWTKWLAAQAVFHNYSFANTMLILTQRPDAQRVASYKAWHKLGRQVKRGERSIRILAPRFKKDEEEDRQVLIGFVSVPVFDISQTEGEELPRSMIEELHGDDRAILESLLAVAEESGARVEYQATLGGANAICDFKKNLIILCKGMSATMTARSLAHEIAHYKLHAETDLSTGAKELEAESVAFIVMSALGIDSGKYSFGYILGWGGETAELKKHGTRIAKCAKEILKMMQGDA